ncbi:MAG: hypothetical protein AAF939_08265 [Planctomycetota bacterium]
MKITSRYEHPHEHFQMQKFKDLAVEFEMARWVKEVYFDSSFSICYIYFDVRVAEGSWIANQVKSMAERTINQFEMFGVIYHGTEPG